MVALGIAANRDNAIPRSSYLFGASWPHVCRSDGSIDDCVDLFRKPALSTIRSAFPQKGRNTPGPLIRLNPAIHSCWMLAHYSGYLLNFFKRSFGRSHPIIGLRALNRFTAVCQALSDMAPNRVSTQPGRLGTDLV